MITRVLPPSPSSRLSPARPHPLNQATAGAASSAWRCNTQRYLDHRVRRTGSAVRIARRSAGRSPPGSCRR